MAASIAEFRAALPQFSAVTDDTLTVYLDMALRSMGDGFGDAEGDAQIFLTAHLMSMAGIGPGAQAGSMAGFSSIKVGSLSLTRAEAAAMGDYAASQYGALYWRLRQRYLTPGFMVTRTGALMGSDPLLYAPPHGQD